MPGQITLGPLTNVALALRIDEDLPLCATVTNGMHEQCTRRCLAGSSHRTRACAWQFR
jgi:hypothetical protein